MKISVILPVYNAEKTIERAIVSIQAQSMVEFELIVINDGSTDNTPDIVKNIASSDSRIRYFSLSHGGIARALNFGIKVSSGQYIARMDADDVSHPDRLHKQLDYLERHPEVGLVSSLVSYKGDASKNEGYLRYVNWINTLTTPQQITIKKFQESPFAHPSVFFRRYLVNQFGGYSEENVPEDYELWLRWLDHGVSLHKINDTLLDWYDTHSRLSRLNTNYSSENFFKVKARYLMRFLNKNFDELPAIYIWGAGRVVNNRVKPFLSLGLTVSKYIDVKQRNQADYKFIHFSQIPEPSTGKLIILCFVSDIKGKKKILNFLCERGFKEGQDFLMLA